MIHQAVTPNTMVPNGRIDSLDQCMQIVISNNIPGDFIECGTWRGGLAALMLDHLVRNNLDRKLYIYDTFEGMPAPSLKDDPRALEKYNQTRDGEFSDWCRADADTVKQTLSGVTANFEQHCVLIPGMVEQTLDHYNANAIALCRVDTDWYESTKKEFEVLYPKISAGGYMIVDDYSDWSGCKLAVDEYMNTQAPDSYEKHLVSGSLVIKKLQSGEQ